MDLRAPRSFQEKYFTPAPKLRDNDVITSGGRVLCAVGLGEKVAQAQRAAYALIECLNFEGAQYRHDIGFRAIERGA